MSENVDSNLVPGVCYPMILFLLIWKFDLINVFPLLSDLLVVPFRLNIRSQVIIHNFNDSIAINNSRVSGSEHVAEMLATTSNLPVLSDQNKLRIHFTDYLITRSVYLDENVSNELKQIKTRTNWNLEKRVKPFLYLIFYVSLLFFIIPKELLVHLYS